MKPEQFAIILISAALILTKLLDVWTTLHGLRQRGAAGEANVWARAWMQRWGVTFAVGLVLALSLLIILASAWMAWDRGPLWGWSYAALGLFISWIQAGVAKANWSGVPNKASRLAWKILARRQTPRV